MNITRTIAIASLSLSYAAIVGIATLTMLGGAEAPNAAVILISV